MPYSLLKRLMLSVPLLLTPLFAAGQASNGYSFSSFQFCTLDDAGQVSCTLALGSERLQPPADLPELTAVTTGQAHACGITSDGQPVCWGGNFFGQLNTPFVDEPLIQIDAGANHTCGLTTSGEAICWGLNTNLQAEPPVDATFSQVDAADILSCGILTDGEVTCWSDDPRRSPQDLEGPFVKIDLRSGAVCGLKENGQIQCADNSSIDVPINPIPFIDPPDNGPYIDIATSLDAVCGLQLDGALDCTFRFPEEVNNFPLGEQFSSIQSNEMDILISTRSILSGTNIQVISGTTMCGERLDGTLQCWDESDVFPGPNGTASTNTELVTSFELELDGRVYGSNAVEIFWTPLPFNSLGTNAIVEPLVEVFRNGELIASQRARFSFFDASAVADATYQIRLVDEAGNAGPLSGVLSVNTGEGTVLFNGEPTLTSSTLDALPDVFMDITTGSLSVGLIVGWQVNPDIEEMIDGFEIRVNGVVAGFTRSRLFVDTITPLVGRCVEIVAVGFDQTRLGARAIGADCN